MPSTPTPVPDRWLLRCSFCRRTVVCLPGQLLRYTRTGWPQCCGEVMSLVTERDTPAEVPDPPARA